MSWWKRLFSGTGSNPAPGKYVGRIDDGRSLIDLRELPDHQLQPEQAKLITAELSGSIGRKVLLVDEAFLLQLADTSVFMAFMELAGRFTGPGDEVFVAHLKGEPPVDVDPATVYLLRSFALEVRPFMIIG